MVPRPAPGGGPAFFGRKPEERTPGRREVLSALDPPLSGWWPERGFLFLQNWPAALHPTPVTARPPAGRAGKRGFADGKGRPCTQPFLVEIKKGAPACRPNGIFLLPRWATRSPPHQSPSVTASPQGEASGLCYPTRKKRPKSGYADGPRNSPPYRNTAPHHAKTSEWQRAGHKKGGPGGKAPGPLSPHFSGEMGTPPGRRAPGALRPEASQEPRPPEGYAVPYRAPSVAAVYTRMGSPVSVSRAWVR